MPRHFVIGVLIGLLSGAVGCARPGLIVRSERGIAPIDPQRVHPVEYVKEDLKRAVAPYAEQLAWVVRRQESQLPVRLAAGLATPADPVQRALVDAYLGWCAARGGADDCLEVLDAQAPGLSIGAKRTIALRMGLASGLQEVAEAVRDINPVKVEALLVIWFTGYLAALLLPEVVTKVLFVLMTANLIAFLGFDGFHNVIEGYRGMRNEAAAAQTFKQLQEPSMVRIVAALVTWGVSSATGMARPVSGFPGAAQASASAQAQGFHLAAVAGGSVTVSANGAVTLVLVAQATVPEGSSGTRTTGNEENGRQLSRNERLTRQKNERIDEYLRQRGRKVEPNPLEGKSGAGRQGDRIVDGVKTEYKTLEPGATDSTIRNVVNASIRRGGQARQIIIDARGSGLTESVAGEGVARAYGIFRGLVDRLVVIGDEFHITFP